MQDHALPLPIPQPTRGELYNRLIWWGSVTLAALLPTIVIYLLFALFLQRSPAQVIPLDSDEIFNWGQVRTFLTAGFEGGYFTAVEAPAAATFSRFYTYGPWFVMLYALPAWLFGWNLYSFGVANLFFVALGTLLCCSIARPKPRQALLIGLALATFWPGMLLVFTAMQESLQHLLALVLAALFYLTLRGRAATPVAVKLALLIAIGIAGMLRMSWVALFLPAFLLMLPATRKGFVLAVVGALIGAAVVVWVWGWSGAPGNNSVMRVLGVVTESPLEGGRLLFQYILFNVWQYLNPAKASWDWVFTVQTLLFIAGSGVAVWRTRGALRAEAALHFFNVGALLAASLVLYIIGTGGDYRLLAAHMTLSLVLLILNRRWRPALLLIAFNLLTVGVFLNTFQDWMGARAPEDTRDVQAFGAQVAPYMPFDPAQPSGWCNTVAIPVGNLTHALNYVPAGIGLTLFWDHTLPDMPFRSRYWLLPLETLALVQAQPQAPPLQTLTETAFGTLYLNPAADCR